MSDVVPVRKFRREIPEAHRVSLDTRLRWLWHQRFGTVQMIWKESQGSGDVLTYTACTLILQAIMAKDLDSISQLFERLEGGAVSDEKLLEQSSMRI